MVPCTCQHRAHRERPCLISRFPPVGGFAAELLFVIRALGFRQELPKWHSEAHLRIHDSFFLFTRGWLMVAPQSALFTTATSYNGTTVASPSASITCNYGTPALGGSGSPVPNRTSTTISNGTTFAMGHSSADFKTSVVVRSSHRPTTRRCSSVEHFLTLTTTGSLHRRLPFSSRPPRALSPSRATSSSTATAPRSSTSGTTSPCRSPSLVRRTGGAQKRPLFAVLG